MRYRLEVETIKASQDHSRYIQGEGLAREEFLKARHSAAVVSLRLYDDKNQLIDSWNNYA